MCSVSGVGLGASVCIRGGGHFYTPHLRPPPARFLQPLGVSTQPAWLRAETTLVPEGWVGLPASSLLFSVTHPEEHSIPGCEPRKESLH